MGEPKFGEPWTDNDDGTILGQTGYLRSPYESLRARVIACVNALAGIDHPEALPALLEALNAWMQPRGENRPWGEIRAMEKAVVDAYRALFERKEG